MLNRFCSNLRAKWVFRCELTTWWPLNDLNRNFGDLRLLQLTSHFGAVVIVSQMSSKSRDMPLSLIQYPWMTPRFKWFCEFFKFYFISTFHHLGNTEYHPEIKFKPSSILNPRGVILKIKNGNGDFFLHFRDNLTWRVSQCGN